jgi:hypothetical protein
MYRKVEGWFETKFEPEKARAIKAKYIHMELKRAFFQSVYSQSRVPMAHKH